MQAELTISSTPSDTGETRDILGVAISDLGRAEALALLQASIAGNRHLKLAFCNAHTANTAAVDPSFRKALASFVVLPDGVGVDIAARLLHGRKFLANLNGTDLVPDLLCSSMAPLQVAMIGGRPGVAERAAAELIRRNPSLVVGPVLDGFSGEAAEATFLDELASRPADVILVAMGNPRQELWIARNIAARHGALAIGVGALFDFLAGEVRRAPAMVRSARLEWAWRLLLEPRRLFRRYVIGNPEFLLRVLASKFRTVAR
ncbi:MAG: WecB/TagA/CpsF family glycosyltransferase [Beijerinckiaceae bacterium]